MVRQYGGLLVDRGGPGWASSTICSLVGTDLPVAPFDSVCVGYVLDLALSMRGEGRRIIGQAMNGFAAVDRKSGKPASVAQLLIWNLLILPIRVTLWGNLTVVSPRGLEDHSLGDVLAGTKVVREVRRLQLLKASCPEPRDR